jgi:hypothetical protein
MPHLASSSFAMQVRSLTRSAMLLLLSAAPLITCGGTTVVEGTDCQTVCEQANKCLGRVGNCSSECGVRADLDMMAGCSGADSAELAGFSTAFMGVSSVPSACSDLCPSCPAQEAAWMACAKAYCDVKPYTMVCQLSGIQ